MNPIPRHYPLWRYALAAALAIGLVLGLNTLSLRIQPEGASEAQFVADGLMRMEKSDIRAVNIGGSVGKSLLFAELGIAGVDLSYPSRDLLENEALIEVVLKKHDHGLRQVFLAVSPLSLLLDNAWMNPHTRWQYYRILAPDRGWRPFDDDWSNLIQGYLLPLARQDRWRGPLAAAFTFWSGTAPSWKVTERPGPGPAPPADTADNPNRLEALQNDMLSLLSRIDGARYFRPRMPERGEATLVRICRTVTARDLDLVIYTTPVTDIYLRNSAVHRAQAAPYWDDAMRQCTAMGARILRFDTDPTFHRAYRLFDDMVHLNEPGSVAFSRKLAQRLGAP